MALLSKTFSLLRSYISEIGKIEQIKTYIDFNILPARKCNLNEYSNFDLIRTSYYHNLCPPTVVDEDELFCLVREGVLSESTINIPLIGDNAIIGKITVTLLDIIKYNWELGIMKKSHDGQLIISSTKFDDSVCYSIINNTLTKFLIDKYDSRGYKIEGFNEKIIHLFEHGKIDKALISCRRNSQPATYIQDIEEGHMEYDDNSICALIYMFCEGQTLIKFANTIDPKRLFYLACKIKKYSNNGCVYKNLDEYIIWYLNHHWDDYAQMISLFYSGVSVPMEFYYTIRPCMFSEIYNLGDVNNKILREYVRHHINKLSIMDRRLLEKCTLTMALSSDVNINSMYYQRIFFYIIIKKFVGKHLPAAIRQDRYVGILIGYILEDAEKERQKYQDRLRQAHVRAEVFR